MIGLIIESMIEPIIGPELDPMIRPYDRVSRVLRPWSYYRVYYRPYDRVRLGNNLGVG